MYRLSVWARHHAGPARLIIVAAYLLLNVTGWLLGEQLAGQHIYLSQTHFYTGAALVLLGFFAYPSKKSKRDFKHFYAFQKSCDGLLAGGTFVMIVCLAQPQSLPQPWMGLPAYATTVPAPAAENAAAKQKPSIFRKAASTAIKWLGVDRVIQKKIHKNWQRLQREYKDASKGEKVALIIATILVALVLLYLVLALSCSLSCNGSDAAAILVGVLGLGLIVFLSVKVITRISRGPKQPKATKDPEPRATTAAF